MKQYFEDIDTLNQFTLELDHHQDELECTTCSKNDQFVSHGFVYKTADVDKEKPVGKRIFCSNRYGKSGCGATLRLYLAEAIPTLSYTTSHLFIFIARLIAWCNIQQAYQAATRTKDPRNAYRWLHRLWRKLIDYRHCLKSRTVCHTDMFTSRTQRLQVLLPTLQALFSALPHNPCAHYQIRKQAPFV